MSKPASMTWATAAGPVHVQYLKGRRVLRLASGGDARAAVEVPLDEFCAGLGIDVAQLAPPCHYLLFADVGGGRDGVSRHVAVAFRDEDSARDAFRALRLEHAERADWAELALVEASGELRRLCWFGRPWGPPGTTMDQWSPEVPGVEQRVADGRRVGSRAMWRLGLRRMAWSVPVLLLATVAVFGIVRATTDPLAQFRATSESTTYGDSGARLLAAERHRLALDRPLPAQYGHWLSGFVRGDWGQSTVSGRSVATEIRSRLWNTSQLIGWAVVVSLIVAVVVGVVSAARPYSAIDHALSGLSFVGLSMPSFWFALMAIELLVFEPKRLLHLSHPLLYSVGLHSATGGGTLDYARHLVLPVLTVSLPLIAGWSRYLRSSMLDVLSAPYLRTAHAKGVPRRRVLLRHALRNALVPFTTVSAIGIGHLFGGVIITETIFGWPGMGQLLFNALLAGDTNVLLPWLVVAASFVLFFNLLADVAHGALDPRVRAA